MNIDEYRAYKAQMAEQTDSEQKEQPNVQAEPSATEPVKEADQTEKQTEPTQPNDEPKAEAPAIPDAIEIDGQSVPLDELKNGYLRQQDYTKKTQEIAKQKREVEQAIMFFEQMKQNPELAQQVGFDTRESEYKELQQNYYDLLVQQEVDSLSKKYPDFDAREVMFVASEKKLDNLEDAYLLNKSRKQSATPVTQETVAPVVDAEALKAQLRAELLAELKAEQNTSTIISTNSGSAPVRDESPKLSPAEQKVARAMGMKESDYAKWRNKK